MKQKKQLKHLVVLILTIWLTFAIMLCYGQCYQGMSPKQVMLVDLDYEVSSYISVLVGNLNKGEVGSQALCNLAKKPDEPAPQNRLHNFYSYSFTRITTQSEVSYLSITRQGDTYSLTTGLYPDPSFYWNFRLMPGIPTISRLRRFSNSLLCRGDCKTAITYPQKSCQTNDTTCH